MRDFSDLWAIVDERRAAFVALADRIWEMPEICYQEWRSSAEHLAMLSAEGFRTETAVAGIPTAMIGEAGQGGRMVALLGEFDALPALSQEAGVAERRPVAEGAPGHGCGHNLLGAAAMLAASAVKEWLARTGRPGRVRYYGCPAEEGGAAKTFMVRAGAFQGVDAAISWHPHAFLQVVPPVSLANTRVDFSFHGKASHAAMAPHLGRSALDAVELMSVGVNYLREHIPSTARLHYAVLDSGGMAPNVVQAFAKVRYAVRATSVTEMMSILGRVRNVAEGAALMTGTRMEMQVISAVSNLLGNEALEESMAGILREVGPPSFDRDDRDFAALFRKTFSQQDISSAFELVGLEPSDSGLCDMVAPMDVADATMPGSTDVGDVSWVVPTVQLHAPTYAIGTQFHSWQMVAQGKSSVAHKGLVTAAKAMAAQAVSVLVDDGLMAAAEEEHSNRLARQGYICPIPEDVRPPIEMSSRSL